MARERWTKEKVIERIQARKAEGKPISYQATVNDEEKLTGAARRLFGSWSKALEAAGFDPEKEKATRERKHRWSEQLVLQRIKELHDSGEDLSPHNVQKIDGSLVASARTYFGSWAKALDSAGFDYNEIKKTEDWTPEKVVERIQHLHKLGAQINDRNIYAYDKSLYGAIQTHFGSWESAVRAAGFDPEEVRLTRKWTKESLREEAKKLIAAGVPVASYLYYDGGMMKGVYLNYGSLEAFYEDLGIAKEKEVVLPNRLREARKEKKLSLEEVGRRLGLSHRAVSMMELGQTPVTLQRALQFARLYEKPVEELFPLENAENCY